MIDIVRFIRLQKWPRVESLFIFSTVVGSSCFISNTYMDEFTIPKWIAFCYGSSIFVLIYALSDVRHKVFCNVYELLLGLISFCILIFLVFKTHLFHDVTIWFVFNCFYIVCRMYSRQNNILNTASVSFIFSAGISSIVAIKQYIENKDLTGCYDNLVGLDITLLLGILSIIYLLKSQVYKKPTKLILCVAISIFLVIALMTKSRLFIMALGIGCIAYFPDKKKILIIPIVSILCLITCFDSRKNESTYGRSLILKTSITLLDSHSRILGGYGESGFKSNYMIRQSEQLKKETDVVRQRAANIIHPLNEFVLISIKYGIIILLLILMTLGVVLWSKTTTLYAKILILVIITYALFSYPLKYPISWIAIAVAMTSNMVNRKHQKRLKYKIHSSVPLLIVGSILFGFVCYSAQIHQDWKGAYTHAVLGQKEQSISKYSDLSKKFKSDEFLYNYSSYLYNLGMVTEANSVLTNISLQDYETNMLSGKIKMSMDLYEEALNSFRLAHDMCPNRFSPLFEIYKIYEKTNDREKQNEYAEIIRNKQIKIPSPQIQYIVDYVTIK